MVRIDGNSGSDALIRVRNVEMRYHRGSETIRVLAAAVLTGCFKVI